MVKLSNILNIEREPFNPDTFQEAEEEEYVNESGTGRMRLRNQNVIRWRRKRNADGTSEVESNARSVIHLCRDLLCNNTDTLSHLL